MSDLAGLLVHTAIRSTLLLAAAFLVARCLARQRPSRRAVFWGAALLALLLIPAAAVLLPPLSVPVLPKPALGSTPPLNPPRPAMADGPSSSEPQPAPAVVSSSPVARPKRPLVSPAIVAYRRPSIQAAGAWVAANWRSVLGIVYLAGLAFALARIGHGLLGSHRLRKGAACWDSAPQIARLSHWRSRLGISRFVELGLSDRIHVPTVIGLLRPLILIPKSFTRRANGPTLDGILVHELAHVKRGDAYWRLLDRLTAALYWYHPLVHLACRKLVEAREQACDDWAVETLGAPERYVQSLLEATAGMDRRIALALGLDIAGAARIADRAGRILDVGTRVFPRAGRAATAIVATTALAASAFLGSLQCTPAAPISTERPQKPVRDERPWDLKADLKRLASGHVGLLDAIFRDRADIVEALLELGANVNYTPMLGLKTPLMMAVEQGNTEIARLLLDFGAVVQATDRNGKTARMIAEEHGRRDIVELIDKKERSGVAIIGKEEPLEIGFDIPPSAQSAVLWVYDRTDLTTVSWPLRYDPHGGHVSIPQISLVDSVHIEIPIHSPAWTYRWDARNLSGNRISSGQYLFSLTLPDGSASRTSCIIIRPEGDRNALSMAILTGRKRLLRTMLERTQNGASDGPASKAIQQDLARSITVGFGIEDTVRTIRANEAVWFAMGVGRADIARLLLRYIPEPYPENLMARLEVSSNRVGAVSALLDRNADLKWLLHTWFRLEACPPSLIDYLVREGFDVNTRDGDGKTALIRASGIIPAVADIGPEKVRVLIEHGADVNVTYNGTLTALTEAVFAGYGDIAWILLENGADVNARYGDKNTPLMVAAMKGRRNLLQLLLEYGADVTLKNMFGKTALSFAEERGDAEIAHLLRRAGAVE